MARGRKAKIGGLRPDQRKPVKELLPNENAEIPALPKAVDYIQKEEWPKPVRDWWESVWLSAMANEYQPSDIHSLYMGAVHLAQSLDADARSADRLKSAQAWEAVLRNFGLQPSARESLRWAIGQAEIASKRTDEIRATKAAPKKVSENDPQGKIISLYDQFR